MLEVISIPELLKGNARIALRGNSVRPSKLRFWLTLTSIAGAAYHQTIPGEPAGL